MKRVVVHVATKEENARLQKYLFKKGWSWNGRKEGIKTKVLNIPNLGISLLEPFVS